MLDCEPARPRVAQAVDRHPPQYDQHRPFERIVGKGQWQRALGLRRIGQ
jgi:hypothetical protein